MQRVKVIVRTALVVALALFWGVDQSVQAQKAGQTLKFKGRITPAERKAAAKRAKALGLKPGIAGLSSGPIGTLAVPVMDPGGVPHYFGPYGNWAYSPLPKGAVTTVTLVDGGTGYSNTPTVTIDDVYGTNPSVSFPATAVGGIVQPITVPALANNLSFTAPIVTITDPTGTGATATAALGGVITGGIHKFVDRMPGLTPANANFLDQDLSTPAIEGQYIPVAVKETRTFSNQASEYYEIAVVEFYERMHSDLPPTRHRGYVQLETPANAPPNGSNHIALKYLDGTPIYYPNTTTQVYAVDKPHFLGPTIVATGGTPGVKDATGNATPIPPVPVRIKFYNLLPAGPANATTGARPGDLFLPVDETVMGSGLGPAGPGVAGSTYTQNRAAVHLHGNNTVWISDGNVHQWLTPANESTPYPKGVSVRNVPDMGAGCDAANSGCMTFYYTNAQSARLMFYHDHSMGITRLNVYAGEAAGYVITDQVEQDLIAGTNVTGVNSPGATPGTFKKVLPDIGIPLVIQDRTFVDETTIWAQDPTWNSGTGPRVAGKITAAIRGDLWFPHVYMSAQNPWDLTGTNAFGRWHYGPWFNPPVPTCVNGLPVGCIEVGPVPNPYYQPDCDLVPPGPGCTAPWEPPFMPGNPNPSIPGEAFMDTPIVNGTAYPYMEVEPKAVRFRVLNAANDRMFNLQLYVAADKNTPTAPGTVGTVPCTTHPTLGGPAYANCTEVKMISTAGQPNQYADWPSGIPDPAFKGPNWIQIGTEGGFMPAPVVVPPKPVGWNLNPTLFNFGTVNQHSLLLGSAERADVVVDFSAYAGQTLILYNDAPAAFPAGVPAYDYFTGVADQTDVGGAPPTLPGYGPNTRTVMQIRVKTLAEITTPTPEVTLANLQEAFKKTAAKRGVFEVSQPPIIIPQAAYNTAYNSTFSATAAGQYVQIADTQKTFQPINTDGVLQPAVTLPIEMKAMHDEMGGVYDTQFGRMSGMLGLSNPTSPVHVLIPYGLASPPTDLVMGSVEGGPIGVLPDGTQLWRIFHNGVDTHTIHTHLFHAQLLNRNGQDGVQLPPDATELGWKDTFRVNPLEITSR